MVYLASPRTQQQAEHVANLPVLLSFACWSPWLNKGYQQSFSNVLIDSGAFSELTGAAKVDVDKYRDWSDQWIGHADAIAGLDDISGDWRRSLSNYQALPATFPTFHDSDPPELLDDLIPMARDRGGWLGIGIVPPRTGKEEWLRATLDRIPDDLHVHGWALRAYTHVRRLNSVDSTNWWRDAMDVRRWVPWLNYGECLDIVIKRYIRAARSVGDTSHDQKLGRRKRGVTTTLASE